MSLFTRQLFALLRKNWWFKMRYKQLLIQEILMPIYFVLILAMIKYLVKTETKPAQSFDAEYLSNYTINSRVLVYPDTPFVRQVMSTAQSNSGGAWNYTVFSTLAAAVDAYKSGDKSSLGVSFDPDPSSGVDYAIRMTYDSTLASNKYFMPQDGSCRDSVTDLSKCPSQRYLASGFVSLQAQLDRAITQINGSYWPAWVEPELKVQRLPKFEWLNTGGASYIQVFSSIYFVLAYSFFIISLMVFLVAEKEKKMRETMHVMGMQAAPYWLSYLIIYTGIILVATAAIVGISVATQLFKHANPGIIFLLLFFYGLSTITLSFMLSAFFSKVRVAAILGSLGTTMASLLYLVVALTREYDGPNMPTSKIPVWAQYIMALLSPVAVAQGMDVTLFLDLIGEGAHWNTINKGEFPISAALIMLAVDSVLYMLLAVYFDHVIPNEYGTAHSPWFFFLPSFWRSKSEGKISDDDIADIPSRDDVEDVGPEMRGRESVRVRGLVKKFKDQDKKWINAVDGLSLDLYEGQITALLGHNGAGKTTFVNILTGLTTSSAGLVSVCGYDTSDATQLAQVRRMTGVCPQHDVLVEVFTPYEHLLTYALLKGVPNEEVEEQVNKILRDVDLYDKRSTQAKHLSGGQKRKLSIGIALIGDPKILLLDEPTAGLDPFSRRHLWSLLKKSAPGRTILLTTHFMDEADILADRKAFISKGRLQCCGSSLFLKNRFGVGYHLNMVRDVEKPVQPITDLITQHVQGAEFARTHGQEVSYRLPQTAVANFAGLFKALENSSGSGSLAESLGVASYGVSMTTLEEVFLKLEGTDQADDGAEGLDNLLKQISSTSASHDKTPGSSESVKFADQIVVNGDVDRFELMSGPPPPSRTVAHLTTQRVRALLKLKFLLLIRTGVNVFYRLIFPVVLLIPGVVLLKTLKLDSNAQNPPVTPLLFPDLYFYKEGASVPGPPLLYGDAVNSTFSQWFLGLLVGQGILPQSINASMNLADVNPVHHGGILMNNISRAHPSNWTQGLATSATLLFNGTALTSLPSVLNIFSSSLLMMANNVTNVTNITINAYPPAVKGAVQLWPSTIATFSGQQAFSSVLLVSMGLAVLPATFALDTVKDREIGARTLLRLAGVSSRLYWCVMFLADAVQFLIVFLLEFILLTALQVQGFTATGPLLSLWLVILCYMTCALLLAYCISFAFADYEKASSSLTTIFFFVSFMPYIAVGNLDNGSSVDLARTLHTIFCFIDPPYALYGGMHYISQTTARYSELNDAQAPVSEYFKWSSGVVPAWLGPLMWAPVFFILLRVLEVKQSGGSLKEAFSCNAHSSDWANSAQTKNDDVIEDEDEDVGAERRRVEQALKGGAAAEVPAVAVVGLRKEFQTPVPDNEQTKKGFCGKSQKRTHIAVRNLTFGVGRGEVFGLLGPNGAGKSTTLATVIAEVSPNRGQVVVGGETVESPVSSALSDLGYCPQKDALWELITLREHIHIFGLLQGLPPEDIEPTARFFEQGLQIAEHKDKKANNLSGGTKRKLSYAISMLGTARVVLLDEPSTGMDPKSKRFLWDTISAAFSGQERGAVLTTHYMEEADALCSRIAIMVNGTMKCVGSSQWLKSRYGNGYLLELKVVAQDDVDAALTTIEDRLRQEFPGMQQSERFGARAMYSVPGDDVTSLARVFALLEEGKRQFGIEEYSFSQASLEQVFLSFAKKQVAEGETAGAERDNAGLDVEMGNGRRKSTNVVTPAEGTFTTL